MCCMMEHDEKWINSFWDYAVLGFLYEEVKNAKQNPEKVKMQYKSQGSICIDTSKMEYVENESDC